MISEDDPDHTIFDVYCDAIMRKEGGRSEALHFLLQQLTIVKESLIVWTEQSGDNMALSFEKPHECAEM